MAGRSSRCYLFNRKDRPFLNDRRDNRSERRSSPSKRPFAVVDVPQEESRLSKENRGDDEPRREVAEALQLQKCQGKVYSKRRDSKSRNQAQNITRSRRELHPSERDLCDLLRSQFIYINSR